MTECNIKSFATPGPFGVATVVHRCETHDMTLPSTVARCPIGKIEDATTKALQAIDSATDDAITSVAKG